MDAKTKEIERLLNELYQDKEFTRKSKYGGITKGIIKDVGISFAYNFLEGEVEKHKNMMIALSSGVKPTEFRPRVYIRSTMNISYDLDEIMIIINK